MLHNEKFTIEKEKNIKVYIFIYIKYLTENKTCLKTQYYTLNIIVHCLLNNEP